MRVFVTGATGFIGSATVSELIGAGHEVVGLARSDAAAAALAAAGATVQRGGLDDVAGLRDGADGADGVIHLAYNHDFSDMEGAAHTDRAAIGAMADALEGSNRPLLIASGVLGLATGRAVTEDDAPVPGFHPRTATAAMTLTLADRAIRSCVVRFPPTVHGQGDKGFVAMQIRIARDKGVSGYIGEGDNCWSAVHRFDAARALRLALEKAPAGSVVHAVADQAVPTRTIAEVIGRHVGVPVVSVAPEDASEHFGWLGLMLALDGSASSARTRELLAWRPTEPALVDDLEAGHYFETAELVA
jgi:nucleoside-diphosphate-sugar epimerase